MKKGLLKTTAYVLTAMLAFGTLSMTAEASGNGSVLPSGGIGVKISGGSKLEDISTATLIPVESMLEVSYWDAHTTFPETKPADEYEDMVVAKVNSYATVRSMPNGRSEILGKIYRDNVATLISQENGWCYITSGSVTGYVNADYLLMGEDAQEKIAEVGTRIATVEAQSLLVRKEADAEAEVIGVVPEAEELLVLEEEEDWIKVDTEEGYGWVSAEFVDLTTRFEYAESKEEETIRLAKEAEERRKARAAASTTKKNTAPVNYTIGEGSEMGVAVIEYALQFVGNPYVYGGTSLTEGADCSGFVLSVYANFGVELPHSSAADRNQGYAVKGLENAQPGDLICYSGHVALYMGNGQIVHASNERTGIKVSEADYRKILAIRRIF